MVLCKQADHRSIPERPLANDFMQLVKPWDFHKHELLKNSESPKKLMRFGNAILSHFVLNKLKKPLKF